MRVVLASASPRRRELLGRLVDDFEVLALDLDEDRWTQPDPVATAHSLAEAKARAGLALRPDCLVIGADTVVALGSRQFGKPKDAEDARAILASLRGNTHEVTTGVSVAWAGGVETWTETARVSFRPLSDAEIALYVETGEPMDKAGAYAIQGGAASFVSQLEGDMHAVIGLPLRRLGELIAEL